MYILFKNFRRPVSSTPYTKYLHFWELLMTLSEAVAAEILHCNNSGVRPPEAVAAGKFAYYPILTITYFAEM